MYTTARVPTGVDDGRPFPWYRQLGGGRGHLRGGQVCRVRDRRGLPDNGTRHFGGDERYRKHNSMSKLRNYRRKMSAKRVTTALMMRRLLTEAGSMSKLKADLPDVFEKVYGGKQQRQVETFAPAVAQGAVTAGGAA